MASPTCVACTVESWHRAGTSGTYSNEQHTCAKNPALNNSTNSKENANSTASAYTFDSYQDDAELTAIYPEAGTGSFDAITYVILGLAGEAGEIANKWKKALRDIPKEYRGSDAYHLTIHNIKASILAELGDVLWYTSRTVDEISDGNAHLGEVAGNNITKLNDRKFRNVLRGSGDDR